MKKNYDRRHRAASLEKLQIGQKVFVKRENRSYEVVNQHSAPRSYILKGPDGDMKRRNRKQIVPVEEGIDLEASPSSMCSDGVELGSHNVTLQHSSKVSVPRRSARQNKGQLPLRYRQ